MLSHILPHQPPHLQIPKYIPDYSSHLSRPKLVNPSYFADPSQPFPASLSPVQPDSPTTVEDEGHSPLSPSSGSGNYHYANRNSGSFNSPISPGRMYDNHPQGVPYAAASHAYHSVSTTQGNYDLTSTSDTMRASQFDRSYLSESPSPVDPHPSSYPQIISAPHSQDRPSQISPSYQASGDRLEASSDIESDRYARSIGADKYSSDNNTQSSTLLDHRRMSEPAVLVAPNPYAPQPSDTQAPHRLQTQFTFNPPAINAPRSSAYVHSLHRGASVGSLRDLRHAHLHYTEPPYSAWKDDYHGDDGFDSPISPLQPDFSGGVDSPTSGLQYSPSAENHYGPSPPGTGTSTTSSVAPLVSPTAPSPLREPVSPSAKDNGSKTYSFVALPGNTVKKRPRRRYDEIERLYQCSWPDCNKAYGTLNHLNAHVTMQKHGSKRSPNEFKELRKQWRKAKKETSPGPMRRSSLRHDSNDYCSRRYDSNNHSSTALYTRQPSYQPSAGLPSAAPPVFTESGDRYPVPVDVDHSQTEERDDHLAAYGAHARQRYGGSTPAAWHSATRVNLNYQHLSSSLPSQPCQSFAQHNSLPPLDTRMHYEPRQPPPRPQSPLPAPMNRLPPDSTLLTPLPGYQPPSILPPLQGNDSMPYPAESGYELYTDNHDGRPHTSHGSIGHGSEEEY